MGSHSREGLREVSRHGNEPSPLAAINTSPGQSRLEEDATPNLNSPGLNWCRRYLWICQLPISYLRFLACSFFSRYKLIFERIRFGSRCKIRLKLQNDFFSSVIFPLGTVPKETVAIPLVSSYNLLITMHH